MQINLILLPVGTSGRQFSIRESASRELMFVDLDRMREAELRTLMQVVWEIAYEQGHQEGWEDS